ncbi:MAG TPA: type II secretion system minor pseudopilin GspJ [Alcanivoracaceae bacterium]|nr:type II secretion system minor pseudopilin GspJ [Alcanivoracaceae bacterium]
MTTSQQQGFTLLEVIIAIAIFAAMYVLAQYAFTQSLDQRAMLAEHAEMKEEKQRALLFLTQDIEQLIARPVRDNYGDLQPALLGTLDTLSFSRLGWANVMDLRQRSQIQRVHYAVDDGQLVRYHWPYLDSQVDAEPIATPLLNGVEEVRWRYLAAQNNAMEWQELWPPLAAEHTHALYQPLPLSLELMVYFKDGSELHRYFRTVINPWVTGGNNG